ncbi:MAG: nuclear transport factor 2 family protein [Kiritimatiellae bacterium]|nr:nuclear transport factor 2 family protein [Kiritimatiellia bacterium]
MHRTDSVPTMEPDSALERDALQRFKDFYEVYSSKSIAAGIREVYADNAWFGDPFQIVEGIDAVEHYFLVMAEPVESCTFEVEAIQRCGKDYYARWTMRLVSRAAKDQPIETIGLSHVRYNAAGKIIFQQDYWDTGAMFERLPVVGFWTRFVKRRIEKSLQK